MILLRRNFAPRLTVSALGAVRMTPPAKCKLVSSPVHCYSTSPPITSYPKWAWPGSHDHFLPILGLGEKCTPRDHVGAALHQKVPHSGGLRRG